MTRLFTTSRLAPWIALAALTLALHARIADAGPPRATRAQRAAARVHFEAAEKAKAAGDLALAGREYLAAFDDYAHPDFLYNAGEVHRLAGADEQALDCFQRYLALDPTGRGADSARARVAELTAAIAARRAAEDRAREEAAAARAAAEGLRARARPEPVVVVSRPAPASPPGRRMRVAGLVTGGAGVAALGVSVFFGLRARRLADQASEADVYDPDLDSRGESAERTMVVAGGVGAAAVATGAVLYFLGRRAATVEARGLTVVPVPGPSSLTVSALLRF